MDAFSQYLHDTTGLSLSKSEVLQIYNKYYDGQLNAVNYDKLLSDLKDGMINQQLFQRGSYNQNIATTTKISTKTFEEVIKIIGAAIQQRLPNMVGKDRLKKAFFLLSTNHSPETTLPLLRTACHNRLNCPISDKQLQLLFDRLDHEGHGSIRLSELIRLCLLQNDSSSESNISTNLISDIGHHQINKQKDHFRRIQHQYAHKKDKSTCINDVVGNSVNIQEQDTNDDEEPFVTYDGRYIMLKPPDSSRCSYFSVQQLEDIVRSKVIERTGSAGSENIAKTFLRLFSDGNCIEGKAVAGGSSRLVSRQQIQYAFWKKLRLNVSEVDLDRLIAKHALSGSNGNRIPLFPMMRSIIRDKAASENEPLLDDKYNAFGHNERSKVAAKIRNNASLSLFFPLMRKHINNLINKESRAPHFLVHSTSRMTVPQTKAFLKSKIGLDVDAQLDAAVVQEVFRCYHVSGSGAGALVDVKRLVLEAMCLDSTALPSSSRSNTASSCPTTSIPSNISNNYSLLNGAIVNVDRMPASLTLTKQKPEEIEKKLREKCAERLKNDHPHASLHKMFRDPDSADNRVITRVGMHRVLNTWDIIMEPDDFEIFFNKHDRGDGCIDIHRFLRRLLPPDDLNSNPFVPKDPKDVQSELQLATVMRKVTGRQREVNHLNGTEYNRLDGNFMEHLSGTKTAATLSTEALKIRAMENGAVNVTNSEVSEIMPETPIHEEKAIGDGTPEVPHSNDYTGIPEGTDRELQKSLKSVFHDFQKMEKQLTNSAVKVKPASRSSLPKKPSSAPKSSRRPSAAPCIDQSVLRNDTPNQSELSTNAGQDELLNHGIPKSTSLQEYFRNQSQMLHRLANIYEGASMTAHEPSNGSPYQTSQQEPTPRRPSSAPPSRRSKNNDSPASSGRKIRVVTDVSTESNNSAAKNHRSFSSIPSKGAFLNLNSDKSAAIGNSSETKNTLKNYLTSPRYRQFLRLQKQLLQKAKSTSRINSSRPFSSRSVQSNGSRGRVTASRGSRPSSSALRSAEFSPRSTARTNTTQLSLTSTQKGALASPAYVYTGQSRARTVDPNGVILRGHYKLAARNATTSHQEYGLFAKNLARCMKNRSRLVQKQHRSEREAVRGIDDALNAGYGQDFDVPEDDNKNRIVPAAQTIGYPYSHQQQRRHHQKAHENIVFGYGS